MKIIFTSVFIFLSFFVGLGQTSIVLLDTNNNVVTNTIINSSIAANSNNTTEILLNNSSSTSKTYKVKRTIISMPFDDSTQFCFGGLCYGFTTNTSGLTATVNSMDTIDFVQNGFHAIFVSGHSSGCSLINYHFYDPSNLSDSSNVGIRYCSTAGVNELSQNNSTISEAFPNPSSSVVSVKYDITSSLQKGKIVFYDVLGKQVKEVLLNDKQGTAKINTEEFHSGIYFYSLLADDKILSTKKMVVYK